MIQLGAALVGVKNATLIEVEVGAASSYSDGHRLRVQGSLEGDNTLGIDDADVVNCDLALRLNLMASASDSLVWVVRLKHDRVSLRPLESLVSEATIAAFVAIASTINKLLFGQLKKISAVEDEVARLQRSDSGKGPARTTLALVLNLVDSSFGSPVN